MAIFNISESGELLDTQGILLPCASHVQFAIWASPDLLLMVGRKGSHTQVLGYILQDGEAHQSYNVAIDVPIKVIDGHIFGEYLDLLFAISTPRGVQFGIFSAQTKQYQLVSEPTSGARFGAWNATEKLLGISIPSSAADDGTHAVIYDYSLVEPRAIELPNDKRVIAAVNSIYSRNKIAITSGGSAAPKVPGIYSSDKHHVHWVDASLDASAMHFSSDGALLLSGGPVEADWIYTVSDGSGVIRDQIQRHDGILLRPVFCLDARFLLAQYESPNIPSVICRYDLLTHQCDDQIRLSEPLRPQVEACHWWVSTPDHTEVPAVVFSSGNTSLPPLVYLHGGPHVNMSKSYSPLIYSLVGRGRPVLAPNFPGSTGYGAAYELANRGDYGGADVRAVIGVAEAAQRCQPGLAGRPALYGTSYGAYLALLAAGLRPELWSCVVACAPITSLAHLYTSANQRIRRHLRLELGSLLENMHELEERSPISWIDNISQVPTLIIHGADDQTCPTEQSRVFAAKMSRLAGRQASFEYIELPGLAHEPNMEYIWTEKVAQFIQTHVS